MLKLAAAVALGVFALVFIMGSPAKAGSTPAQKCASGKIKSAGKKAACLLNIDAGVVAKGGTADPAKVGKCKTRLSSSYTKLDSKGGCATTGNGGTIEGKVDAFEGDVKGELSVGGPSKCQAAKIKAAGKKAACLLSVDAKAASTGSATPDPSKVGKCKSKLSATFAKNEANGGCTTSGDTGAIEGKVDMFVDDAFAELTSTMAPGCCGTPTPTKITFTTGIGSGNCGSTTRFDGTPGPTNGGTGALSCGAFYVGGGVHSVSARIPDQGASVIAVASCSGTVLTLGPAANGALGATQRTCTKSGCFFGPPLPIPNLGAPPISMCVINTLSSDLSGSADCGTGTSSVSMPLNSEIFLTGDLDSNGSNGIQPCPICATGQPITGTCTTGTCCVNGDNAGHDCTPGDTASSTAFPTSLDCLPPAAKDIGGLPIGFNLSTGTVRWTAVPDAIGGISHARAFCGYCQDTTSSGCYEGDPHTTATATCSNVSGGPPVNAGVSCTRANCPGASCECTPCTAASCCEAGTCPASAASGAHKCLENGATSGPGISACSGAYDSCTQRDEGAFGPGGGGVQTITATGAPAGDLSDHMPHPSTLVSVHCIPPFLNTNNGGFVDGDLDLPGPGAVALPGQVQLQ